MNAAEQFDEAAAKASSRLEEVKRKIEKADPEHAWFLVGEELLLKGVVFQVRSVGNREIRLRTVYPRKEK